MGFGFIPISHSLACKYLIETISFLVIIIAPLHGSEDCLIGVMLTIVCLTRHLFQH